MIIKEAPLTDVWVLRLEVMYTGQSMAMVRLNDDESGLHLGLYDNDMLLSVVSLFANGESMQFRKFATRKDHQGKGLGTYLLKHVMEYAAKNNCTEIWCNARLTAVRLYKKFGMEQTGEPWQKNGIEYIKMQKKVEDYGNYTSN